MSFVFPVIGKTEWSGGSWMPSTQTHRGRTHAAVDIYASRGQTIVSPVSGTVRSVGSTNIGGNWIQIQGSDGKIYYFAHMDSATTLKKGQSVRGGQAIGAVGNSGSASRTSPHLHFSIKSSNGSAINPVPLLRGGVVVPDLEFEKTGVKGGAGTVPGAFVPPDWANIVNNPGGSDEPLPQAAQQEVPAWFDQLAKYRQELLNQPATENPTKIKARRVMHGTLAGMANMVRRAGFESEQPLGVDEDLNEVSRTEGER